MLLPEKIFRATFPKELKIVRLWAITQLAYRSPYGDLALDYLHRLVDETTVQAIFFITGAALTARSPCEFRILVPNYDVTETQRYNTEHL